MKTEGTKSCFVVSDRGWPRGRGDPRTLPRQPRGSSPRLGVQAPPSPAFLGMPPLPAPRPGFGGPLAPPAPFLGSAASPPQPRARFRCAGVGSGGGGSRVPPFPSRILFIPPSFFGFFPPPHHPHPGPCRCHRDTGGGGDLELKMTLFPRKTERRGVWGEGEGSIKIK